MRSSGKLQNRRAEGWPFTAVKAFLPIDATAHAAYLSIINPQTERVFAVGAVSTSYFPA